MHTAMPRRIVLPAGRRGCVLLARWLAQWRSRGSLHGLAEKYLQHLASSRPRSDLRPPPAVGVTDPPQTAATEHPEEGGRRLEPKWLYSLSLALSLFPSSSAFSLDGRTTTRAPSPRIQACLVRPSWSVLVRARFRKCHAGHAKLPHRFNPPPASQDGPPAMLSARLTQQGLPNGCSFH